ncbi:Putative membrane protein, MmpL [Mycobacteroides abscessus subsp. abscessus]|nr:MMPL family transporter [Mycobacteroides abscessus]SIL17074.1 Putative membrane protein, MmpL [Mycobacteroides abscessus subsp. abscessus]
MTSELEAAHQAVKGTALTDAKFYLAGTAAIYRDIQSGARYDLLIVGIASVTLIFVVMMIITRAFVASLAIVGTVLLSLGAAFGISVLHLDHRHRERRRGHSPDGGTASTDHRRCQVHAGHPADHA